MPECQRWVPHCGQPENLSQVSVRRSLIVTSACVDLCLLPRCMSALTVYHVNLSLMGFGTYMDAVCLLSRAETRLLTVLYRLW
jgi:hypothetical protein